MTRSKKETDSTTVRARRSTVTRLGAVLKRLQERPESAPPSLKAEIGDQEPITGPVLLDALVARAQRELEAPQREATWQSKLSPARRAERRHGQLTHDLVGLRLREGADLDEALDELNSPEVLVVAVPEASRAGRGGAEALCLLRKADIEQVAKSSLVEAVVDLPKIDPSIERSRQSQSFPIELLAQQTEKDSLLREAGKRWTTDLMSLHPKGFLFPLEARDVLEEKDPASRILKTDSDVVVVRVLYGQGSAFYGSARAISEYLPMYVEDEIDSKDTPSAAVKSALVVGTRKAVCLLLRLLRGEAFVSLPFGKKSFDSFWTAEDSLPPRRFRSLATSVFGVNGDLASEMSAVMTKHSYEQTHLRGGFILASTVALNGKKPHIKPTKGIVGSSIEGDVYWWCLDLGSVTFEGDRGSELSAIRVVVHPGGRVAVFRHLKDLFLHWVSVTPADSDLKHIAAALSSATTPHFKPNYQHLSPADESEILAIIKERTKPPTDSESRPATTKQLLVNLESVLLDAIDDTRRSRGISSDWQLEREDVVNHLRARMVLKYGEIVASMLTDDDISRSIDALDQKKLVSLSRKGTKIVPRWTFGTQPGSTG